MTTVISSSTLSFRSPNLNFHPLSKPSCPHRLLLPLRPKPPYPRLVAAASVPPPSAGNPLSNYVTSLSSIVSHVVAPLGDVPFRSAGSNLLAALANRREEFLVPLTAVAAGMAKWLELYSGVLMVRVLLSWFPNIPWNRQPFSALRDLCDPYLNLFRRITPQVFGKLDLSPILAFAVLGMVTSLLSTSRGVGVY